MKVGKAGLYTLLHTCTPTKTKCNVLQTVFHLIWWSIGGSDTLYCNLQFLSGKNFLLPNNGRFSATLQHSLDRTQNLSEVTQEVFKRDFGGCLCKGRVRKKFGNRVFTVYGTVSRGHQRWNMLSKELTWCCETFNALWSFHVRSWLKCLPVTGSHTSIGQLGCHQYR